MKKIYEYIGEHFVGNRYHIVCDCFVALDIKGICVGYEANKGELILQFESGGKTIPIGVNTPNLMIKEIA